MSQIRNQDYDNLPLEVRGENALATLEVLLAEIDSVRQRQPTTSHDSLDIYGRLVQWRMGVGQRLAAVGINHELISEIESAIEWEPSHYGLDDPDAAYLREAESHYRNVSRLLGSLRADPRSVLRQTLDGSAAQLTESFNRAVDERIAAVIQAKDAELMALRARATALDPAGPQREAVELLLEVVRHLSQMGNKDLKTQLRKCQHVCDLLGWEDQKARFRQELIGYPADAIVPPYRHIAGRLVWRSKGIPGLGRRKQLKTFDEIHDDLCEQPTKLGVRWGIDQIERSVARWGLVEKPTSERRSRWMSGNSEPRELVLTAVFTPESFLSILEAIEHSVFDFASERCSYLRYGNTLTDIWSLYRKTVDAWLQQIGKSAHLEAIQSGLSSDNPAMWRTAMQACRNLLEDVVAYLWRDTRDTYEHLYIGGDRKKGGIRVTGNEPKNRLLAYLHQKLPWRASETEHLKTQAERLFDSLRALYDLQSKAHAPVRKESALSVALSTYVLLGELVILTDARPIEHYGDPSLYLEQSKQLVPN
ncbi:MAG: AbiTii domain-containing protein [Chloroflexota bacterium]